MGTENTVHGGLWARPAGSPEGPCLECRQAEGQEPRREPPSSSSHGPGPDSTSAPEKGSLAGEVRPADAHFQLSQHLLAHPVRLTLAHSCTYVSTDLCAHACQFSHMETMWLHREGLSPALELVTLQVPGPSCVSGSPSMG